MIIFLDDNSGNLEMINHGQVYGGVSIDLMRNIGLAHRGLSLPLSRAGHSLIMEIAKKGGT